MSLAWENQLVRISTGKLNTVDETVIANAPTFPGGTVSRFAGQLGKTVSFTADQIGAVTDTTVGTLYAGRYRYVKFRATDDASPNYQVGQILFIDTTVTNWQSAFQVTRDENLSSTANATMIAGIYIGGPEPGDYGFIQDMGLVNIRFRSVLTAAGAVGIGVYAAATGDTGSDQGTADVLTTDSTSVANQRFIGNAIAAPSGGSLTLVAMQIRNPWTIG